MPPSDNDTKKQVLIIGTFPQATMDELRGRFFVHHFLRLQDAIAGLTATAGADVVGVGTEANQGLGRSLLERLPKIKVVALFGVGMDLIDRPALAERNIALTNTPGLVGTEVADLAMGLLLASARQIILADRYVRDGRWSSDPIGFGRSVGYKTAGVVGLGSIGRPIADRAAAFNMHVAYVATNAKPNCPYEFIGNVVELARRSDFLIVACKGGPETFHLISAEVLDALGPGGTIVNVARGSVVDEAAMIERLRDGRLGFAALDVFEDEPNPASALLNLPNVIVQPHHGSAALETRVAMGTLMIGNLAAALTGQDLMTPVASA